MSEHPGVVVDGSRPAAEWVTALPREWVSTTERLVLLALACDSYDGITSAPTTAALMAWTGLYKGTLLRNLTRLCTPTEHRPALLTASRSGGRHRTVYTFTHAQPVSPVGPVSPAGPVPDVEPVSPAGPVNGSPTGLTNRSHEPVSPVRPLPTLTLEEEGGRAREWVRPSDVADPDDPPDVAAWLDALLHVLATDPEANDPDEEAAYWLVVRAADVLGCEPGDWTGVGLVDQVAAAIRDGHDPDAIFHRLTCGHRAGELWPAPEHVKSWPGLLDKRFRDFRSTATNGTT